MLRDANRIPVFYEVFGAGRPIVMLHGWSLDHQHMVKTMEPLFEGRPGWRRIYPDLPGHGRTPGADWITNLDGMLEAVLTFLDDIIPEQRFALAGVSAGAYLARGVVYRRHAAVAGLALVVPVIVPQDDRRTVPPPVTLVANPELVAELKLNEPELLSLVVVQNRQVLESLLPGYVAEAGAPDLEFQARIRENTSSYAFSYDVDALPSPFLGPTLMLMGRQDALVGYRDAWRILENYPRATFAALDRAGHFLELEQPQLYRALVDEWLDRVEAEEVKRQDEMARGVAPDVGH